MLFIFAKFFILLPLIVALAVIEHTRRAADKISDVDDRKEVLDEVRKALCYVLVAGALGMWLIPSVGGGWLFFGFLVSVIFAMFIILSVVELPKWRPFNPVHNWAWGTWRKTPIYSRTDEPVERVRWGRRFALVAFALMVVCLALFAGVPSGTTSNQASYGTSPVTSLPAITPSTTAAPTTTLSAPVTTTNTAVPSAMATTTTEQPIDNSCDGPKQLTKLTKPVLKPFGVGSLQICNSGKWQSWSDIAPGANPPPTVEVLAWTVDSSYGYGAVSDPATGDQYIVKTSDYNPTPSTTTGR